MDLSIETKTWGVCWYVEVVAETYEEAVENARGILIPKWRKDREPISVEEIDPEVEAIGERL